MAKVEDALRQANREWERTFDSVPDLIAILDCQHRIIRVNKAMASRLGVSREKCVGLTCFECVHGKSQPIAFCPHVQTLQDGKEHVAEIHDDGLGGDFIVSTTPLFDEQERMIGSVHVARDITERKRGERMERSSLERYRSFIEVTGELGWTTNADGEVVEDIPSFRKFTGQTYEEAKGWGWSEALHPDDVERTKQVWKKATETRSKYEIEYRLRRFDGVYRYFLARGVPVSDEDGFVREWVGTCIDITRHKELEKELFDSLQASQARQSEVSALLRASKEVLQHREFQESARVIFDSCKDLLGATAGYVALLSNDGKENEVLFLDSGGWPCTVNPSLPMPIRGLRAEAYSHGRVVYNNDFPTSEWVKLMPEGHVTLENVLFAPLTIDNKTLGVIGLANKPDGFTEHNAEMAMAFASIAAVALINSRVLETLETLVEERTKQLKDSERLAAIGQTAAMVGHDIRNPLQAIIGDVFLAKGDVNSLPQNDSKESLKESLMAIEENIGYINKIVADLQDFAKPLSPCTEETDLKSVIDDLLRNGVPTNILSEVRVNIKARTIMADSAYMKRILGNLISNAVQAMPNGGKLRICANPEEKNAVITVEDTGMGVPEPARTKLFTPLFTTKSKGQGFGLAVVKRLTEALGGTITFDSEVGKGTKFIVHLPQQKK